jgi:hypothetical protein
MIPWWQRNTIHGRVEVVLMWVLALLMAGLFVLWATVGWGGEATCQEKMEAAMTAMDEFVEGPDHFSVTLENYSDEAIAKATAWGKRWDAALALWRQSKPGCWGTP